MITSDIVKDTAILTTSSEKVLRKILHTMLYGINETVAEARESGESVVELDLEIGKLYIQLLNDSIKYKFVPSSELENSVKATFINKQNLLEDVLEASAKTKITYYKDIFK